MTWLALLKHWKLILGGLALSAALIWGAIGHMQARHWHKVADQKQATIEKLLQAQALATAQAKSAKLAKEAEYARVKREQDSEKRNAEILASDNARLRQWVRDHPAQGPARQADLPGAAGAASQPDRSDSVAAVDERYLAICSANTRRLLNAQEWGAKIQNTQGAER